ncbi:MAG: DUF4097 family beta strand repeat protein [Gammaproteobacteria bacterium]|nr:DUF4097 family beta strand repeat protein [Gammaproteobacteria bacterium]
MIRAWFVGSLLALPTFLNAEVVDKKIDAAGVARVVIDIPRGRVSIKGVKTDSIAVAGEIDDDRHEFVFQRKGDRAELRVEMSDNGSWGGGKQTDLTVEVPESGVVVWVNGIATQITVSDVMSNTRIDTVSGDIRLTNIGSLRNHHTIASVSGEVELTNVRGAMVLSSVSGDVSGRVESENLRANVVSGELTLVMDKLLQVAVTSVSGDISLTGTARNEAPYSDIKLSTVNGEALLRINADYQGLLRLQTGPGGDIENHLTEARAQASFLGEQHLKLQLGQLKNEVDLSTVSGTLVLTPN